MQHKVCNRTTMLVSCVAVLCSTSCGLAPERSALAQGSDERRYPSTRATTSAEGMADVSVRRVWTGEYHDFYASSISPDGRYLSMIDYSTFDLAVRDLRTDQLHRLTDVQLWRQGGPWQEASVSEFSPDGRKIVVNWFYDPDTQLRMLDFAPDEHGVPAVAEPDVLFHNPLYIPYWPIDWSPDGREVLAIVYVAENTSQLALIGTTDGAYRVLKSFDWREPTLAAFSPDGRYVAYDFPREVGSSNRDLFVLSVDGTSDARVVEGSAADELLGWHPNGSILFYSDRGGTPGVWRVPMAEGRAVGQPELVKPDLWGIDPLGFAHDGFYYGVTVNPTRLVTGAVDLGTGRLLSTPHPFVDPTRADVIGWDWSPDGQFLAYSAKIPGRPGSMIGILTASGEEIASFRLDLERTSRIRWHPDQKSLVLFTSDPKGRRGFYLVDLESGEYETILRTDILGERTPRGEFDLSPDGGTLYYARGDQSLQSSRQLNLVAHDIETGDDRFVTGVSGNGWGTVARSPDGARLAVVKPAGSEYVIGVIPTSGEGFSPLVRIPPDVQIFALGWTTDNRIYYSAVRPSEGVTRMYVVTVAGGEPLEVNLDRAGLRGPKMHPDGRRIAFLTGEPHGEVWVMEGLGHGSVTEVSTNNAR